MRWKQESVQIRTVWQADTLKLWKIVLFDFPSLHFLQLNRKHCSAPVCVFACSLCYIVISNQWVLLSSIIHRNMAFALLWAHTEMYLCKRQLQGNIWDIFGAGLWQNNLMHGCWQLHQQYLHAGIGPSPLSEVTHRPWIMLPCSGVLWSRGMTVLTAPQCGLSPPLMLLPFPSPHIPTTGPVM